MYTARVEDDELLSSKGDDASRWKKYLVPNEEMNEKEFKEKKMHR